MSSVLTARSSISPMAGLHAVEEMLVDVLHLEREHYNRRTSIRSMPRVSAMKLTWKR
jgi:hypothetical protein